MSKVKNGAKVCSFVRSFRFSFIFLIWFLALPGGHQAGHSKNNDEDSMPTPDAQEDTRQLQRTSASSSLDMELIMIY